MGQDVSRAGCSPSVGPEFVGQDLTGAISLGQEVLGQDVSRARSSCWAELRGERRHWGNISGAER